MALRKKRWRDIKEQKENALRPSRYLGYDHDRLGMHLISRGAYEIALRCFRRAIWLNPFEPAFKEHLAYCIQKLEQIEGGKTVANSCDKNERAGS